MRKLLILAAIAACALASAADAKQCRDAKGKFIKCPPAAAAPAAAGATTTSAAKPKHCVKGKACGNSCIKVTDVCHKP